MAVNKKSLDNLTNIADQGMTKEQLSENGKKGGVASGKARREKKEMRDLVQDILNMNVKSGKAEEFKNLAESKGKNISVQEALVLAQIKKAMNGDTRAIEFLRDTAGQRPVEKREYKAEVNNGKLSEILNALTENDENDESEDK